MASPLWTPKKVAIDESTRDIPIAARPNKKRTSSPAPVSLHTQPAEIQLLDRRQQFERECILDPVLVDDRCDLGLHERAHLFRSARSSGSRCRRAIEVAVWSRQRLWRRAFRSRPSVFTGASTVMVLVRGCGEFGFNGRSNGPGLSFNRLLIHPMSSFASV